MNEAITFDTHRFIKNLTGHGFTEDQAEVLSNEQVNILNNNLATQADIDQSRLATQAEIAGIKADIKKLRLATQADIKGVKADIEKLCLAT